MARIKIDGVEKGYPEGTTWLEVAREHQGAYEDCLLYTSDAADDV